MSKAEYKKALAHLSRQDKALGKLILKSGPCTLEVDNTKSPFSALMRSIVYQQLHGKAAATILGRVHDLFPKRRILKPEDLLQTSDKLLRSAGLSGAKTAAIKDLAQKTIDGLVPSQKKIEKMSDEEILQSLVQIRGIGPWTVEMLLIFKLGRLDVLPATDFGVRNGFQITYKKKEMPTPKELLAHGEKWRPYRSVAAWYMWRAVDLFREQKKS